MTMMMTTALCLWRRLGCGTACQPLWPRHHRRQRLRGTWRLNCSPEAVLHDSFGRVWQFLVRSTVTRTFKTFLELCSVSPQSSDSTPPLSLRLMTMYVVQLRSVSPLWVSCVVEERPCWWRCSVLYTQVIPCDHGPLHRVGSRQGTSSLMLTLLVIKRVWLWQCNMA